MFVRLRIRRGLEPIKPLLNVLKGRDAFICGGYVRYCASPNSGDRLAKARDVDIYCKDNVTYNKLAAWFKAEGLKIRYENPMAVTYLKVKKKTNPYYGTPIIQLIKPVVEGAVVAAGEMETILENFDFTVIRCGIVKKEDGTGYEVLADPSFLEDEKRRFLRIIKIHCPVSSLLRFMKYARKGYSTRPSELMKLFEDWDRRSTTYRARMVELFAKVPELTIEEIDELEALLRID